MEIKIIETNVKNFKVYDELTYGKTITNSFNNVFCNIYPNNKDYRNVENVLFEYPKQITLYLAYPLSVVVEVKGTVNSLYDIIDLIREAYAKIYKAPKKYGIWGHAIGDLSIELIKIYDNNKVMLYIGS